jgi:hypothetical protein
MSTRFESDPNFQPSAEERRFDRNSWAVLALASFVYLYSLVLALYVAQLPTDGWDFHFDLAQSDPGYVFTEYYGSGPSPLQSGDVLIAIEGKPMAQVVAETFALRSPRPASWQAGSTVEYTVRREGRELALTVPLARLFPQMTWNYISRQLGGPLYVLMSPVMIGIGFLVFMRRPQYLPAQLLLLFSWSLAGSQLGFAPSSVAIVLDPFALFLFHTPILISIWQITILPVLVHLLLVFPVVKPILRRHPRLVLLALYVPVQIEMWLALALNLGRPAEVVSAWNTIQALQILVLFGLMIASIAHTFRSVRDPTVLAQMRWIAVGVLFGFMGAVLIWLFITLFGVSRTYFSFLIFPFLLLPISLAIAILRYRLFDIQFIIRRTLIYGAVSALLALIFACSVIALQMIFRAIIGQASDIAIAISTLGTAALALPMRNRIQAAIDRAFFRQKYDAQKTLEAFVADLQNRTDLEGLARETRAVIQDTLQPASVKVWLAAVAIQRSEKPEAPDEIRRIAADDPIIARLPRARSVLEVDRLPPASPAVRTMKEDGAILAAKMVHQGEVIGLIVLGPRRSEQGYATDDYRLLNNLATQAAPAFRVADLVRVQNEAARRREQIEQEMHVARSIQRTLLPQGQLALDGWRVEASYQPARAVGGDFYDFIRLPDGRVSIIIGDVTDKGMPAALVMAVTRTLLRDTTRLHDSPGTILSTANDSLVGDIPENMFITCFYAILDPASGKLIYANAGHNLPFWRTRAGVHELRARGMPLGLMPAMSYEQAEIRLEPEETVLFYTDGLIEAHNAEGAMFGLSQVQQLIAGHPGGPELVPYLLEHWAAFTGPGWEQEDDTTTIILQKLAQLSSRRSKAQ